ncbi:MAG: hypothetical protein H7A21_11205 [Spirochaetales bacterium]|nr:hypothetical protein [Leptospiraceae bacterium]MCP5481993.1 hypothetical protein [Spirochaetales bacterium]MCP5486474.1 hypothetical protein [Spirochaetales bacterium]
MDYIPINSIDEIDPARISIRDINKRYVDREGNRYATRFNLQTRQIEVVRLFKNRQEALRLRQDILKDRAEERIRRRDEIRARRAAEAEDLDVEEASQNPERRPEPVASAPPEDDLDLEGLELSDVEPPQPKRGAAPPPEPPEKMFIEKQFVEELAQELSRTKERQQVILNHLKNAHYWEKGKAGDFSEIERELDLECWQECESAVNYYRELYGYPRSVSHYMIRLDEDEKKKAEAMPDDAARMEMIRRWETRRTFRKMFEVIRKKTERLVELAGAISEQEMRALPAAQQKQVQDSRVSADLSIKDAERRLREIDYWQKRHP